MKIDKGMFGKTIFEGWNCESICRIQSDKQYINNMDY